MSFKKNPKVWIGLILSAASLVALFYFIEPGKILAAIRDANGWLLLAAFPLVGAHFTLRAVRWRYMLGNELNFATIFHNQNIGNMINQILPLRLGDIARAVLIGHTKKHSTPEVLSVVAVERVLDVAAVLLLLPLTLSQVPRLPNWMSRSIWLLGLAAVVALAIAVYAAKHQEQMRRWVEWAIEKTPKLDLSKYENAIGTLFEGLSFFKSWRATGIIALYSILIWIPMIAGYWVVLRAVTPEAHVLVATFALVAGSLSISAPSSPGQLGVYHAGVTAALVAAKVPREISASFAFLFHAIYMSTIIGMGIVGLMRTDATLRRTIESTMAFFDGDEQPEEQQPVMETA